MTDQQTGWIWIQSQITGKFDTEYYWDGVFHPTKAAALEAGEKYFEGGDDFNVANIKDGKIVWFGYYDTRHPMEDWVEVGFALDFEHPLFPEACRSYLAVMERLRGIATRQGSRLSTAQQIPVAMAEALRAVGHIDEATAFEQWFLSEQDINADE